MCYKTVKSPNLPKSKVTRCLIGAKYTEEKEELQSLGITCLLLSENQALEDEINNHADILCCNLGNGKILISDSSIGERSLDEIGYNPSFIKGIASPYPNDISLNCAVINNKFVCNEAHTNPLIKDFVTKNNYELINTNQGYSRCNLCIVNSNAVITEDKALASLLKKYQFDVLEISSGDVHLSEVHHGFLGGASGKVSESEIYFSGDLSSHKDYKMILDFLNKYNVKPIFNKNRKLRDFGGFIQLTEKI